MRITPIIRKFTAALSICESSLFTNRMGADFQIISILSSHNGLESFMRHLYYSLSAFDDVKHVKLVFEKEKRKIMKANEAKSPQDHGHREPAKILLMFSPISAH